MATRFCHENLMADVPGGFQSMGLQRVGQTEQRSLHRKEDVGRDSGSVDRPRSGLRASEIAVDVMAGLDLTSARQSPCCPEQTAVREGDDLSLERSGGQSTEP